MTEQLLKIGQVVEITGLSRSAIYAMMRQGRFPEPVKLAAKAVRWRESELQAWVDNLPRATGELG